MKGDIKYELLKYAEEEKLYIYSILFQLSSSCTKLVTQKCKFIKASIATKSHLMENKLAEEVNTIENKKNKR